MNSENIKILLSAAGFNDADINSVITNEAALDDAKLAELKQSPQKYFEQALSKKIESAQAEQNLKHIQNVLGIEKLDDFSGKTYEEQIKYIKTFFEKQKETELKKLKDTNGQNLGEILEAQKKESEGKLAELMAKIKAFETEKEQSMREKAVYDLIKDKKFISSFADEKGKKTVAELLRSTLFGGGNVFKDVGTIKNVLHDDKGEIVHKEGKLQTIESIADDFLSPFLAKSEPPPQQQQNIGNNNNNNNNTPFYAQGGGGGGNNSNSLEAILNSFAPLKN